MLKLTIIIFLMEMNNRNIKYQYQQILIFYFTINLYFIKMYPRIQGPPPNWISPFQKTKQLLRKTYISFKRLFYNKWRHQYPRAYESQIMRSIISGWQRMNTDKKLFYYSQNRQAIEQEHLRENMSDSESNLVIDRSDSQNQRQRKILHNQRITEKRNTKLVDIGLQPLIGRYANVRVFIDDQQQVQQVNGSDFQRDQDARRRINGDEITDQDSNNSVQVGRNTMVFRDQQGLVFGRPLRQRKALVKKKNVQKQRYQQLKTKFTKLYFGLLRSLHPQWEPSQVFQALKMNMKLLQAFGALQLSQKNDPYQRDPLNPDKQVISIQCAQCNKTVGKWGYAQHMKTHPYGYQQAKSFETKQRCRTKQFFEVVMYGQTSTIYFQKKKAVAQFEKFKKTVDFGYIRKVNFLKKTSKVITSISQLSRSEKIALNRFSIQNFEHYWKFSKKKTSSSDSQASLDSSTSSKKTMKKSIDKSSNGGEKQEMEVIHPSKKHNHQINQWSLADQQKRSSLKKLKQHQMKIQLDEGKHLLNEKESSFKFVDYSIKLKPKVFYQDEIYADSDEKEEVTKRN